MPGPRDTVKIKKYLAGRFKRAGLLAGDMLGDMGIDTEDMPLYWCSADMTALSVTASADVPPTPADIARPSETGLIVWDGDAGTVTLQGMGTRPLRAVYWHQIGAMISLHVLVDDGRDVITPTTVMCSSRGPMDFNSLFGGLTGPTIGQEDQEHVLHLTCASWILMQQPRISGAIKRLPANRREYI